MVCLTITNDRGVWEIVTVIESVTISKLQTKERSIVDQEIRQRLRLMYFMEGGKEYEPKQGQY